jgi:hypothetical protein
MARRWKRFSAIFDELNECHPNAAAVLYIVPDRGFPKSLFTNSTVQFQNSPSFVDFQNSLQRFQQSIATSGSISTELLIEPCFTSAQRRGLDLHDPEALQKIFRSPLGGRVVDHLRKFISDIKRHFDDCELPSTQSLTLQSITDLLGSLSAPGSVPSSLQIWNSLSESFGVRHGTGPELLMIIRILDWLAFARKDPPLPVHVLERADTDVGLATADLLPVENLDADDLIAVNSELLASSTTLLPLPPVENPDAHDLIDVNLELIDSSTALLPLAPVENPDAHDLIAQDTISPIAVNTECTVQNLNEGSRERRDASPAPASSRKRVKVVKVKPH